MTERIHINYYQYVDVTLVDGKIVIVNNKDIPENTLRIEDDRLFCCDKIIAEIDNSTGKITSTKEYISSLEVKNYSLFLEFSEKNEDYNKNRIRFNNDKNEYKDYPIELHTHFMEVLSDIEFLDVMKNLLPEELKNEPCIPIKKDGSIFDKNERAALFNSTLFKNRIYNSQDKYEWLTIEEAKRNPKVLDNLRLPTNKQSQFEELNACIENRSFIVDIIAHINAKQGAYDILLNNTKVADASANIRSTFKLRIYEEMLKKSLEVLKKQGVEYVEFSYSNLNTIKNMVKYGVKVEGITYKFLLSEDRNHNKKAFKGNARGVKDIIENPKIAGFDLMGKEAEIDLSIEINDSNKNNDKYNWITDVKNHLNPYLSFRSDDKMFSGYMCVSLYDKLKLVIINMLMGNKKRPTLRLHAGEMNYGEGSWNPGYILVILKEIENDLKTEIANDEEIKKILHIDDLENFQLKDRLNIRIGHGLHFKEEFKDHRDKTYNYFELLRDFDAIVEICQSSNFSLSNITDLSKIPFEQYAAKGIPLVIGTDGEGTYLATLKQELRNAGPEVNEYLTNCIYIVRKRLTEGEELFDAKKKPVDLSNWIDTNRGLYYTITVNECIRDLPQSLYYSSFIHGLRQTSNRRGYINDYFSNNNRLDFEEEKVFEDNLDEKEKIRRELFVVKNLYHEKMINEVYYDVNERDIITSSISAAEEALEHNEILKAASITVSIQALMGCRIKLNKVLFYLIYNNKSFTDCIKEEVYNIDKELEYKKLLEYKRRLENEKKYRDYRNNIYLNTEEEKIIEGYNNIINRNDEIREYLEKYCNNYRYGEGKELLEKYNIISKLNDEDWKIIEKYINIINRNNGNSSDIQNQDKLTGGIYDDEESHRRNK